MIVRYCTPEDQLYFITADNRSLFKNREFSVVFRGGSAGTSAHTSSSKTRASSGSGSTYSESRRRARIACDSRSLCGLQCSCSCQSSLLPLSVPVAKRLMAMPRKPSNQSLEPTAGRCDDLLTAHLRSPTAQRQTRRRSDFRCIAVRSAVVRRVKRSRETQS